MTPVILACSLLAASFILSAILTAIVRKISLRTGFVSKPSADRYNESVIPLGGGIAIFWTIAIILLTSAAVIKFLLAPGHLDWLGESITIHAVGFLDNINNLLIVIACALALHLVVWIATG